MGFYSPSQLLRDAIAHGVECRPADVQASGWDYRLECDREGARPAAQGETAMKNGNAAVAVRLGAAAGEGPWRGRRAPRRKRPALPRHKRPRRPRHLGRPRDHVPRPRRSAGRPVRTPPSSALGRRRGSSAGGHLGKPPRRASNTAPRSPLPAPNPGENMLADYNYLGLTLGPPSHDAAARRAGNSSAAAPPRNCKAAATSSSCKWPHRHLPAAARAPPPAWCSSPWRTRPATATSWCGAACWRAFAPRALAKPPAGREGPGAARRPGDSRGGRRIARPKPQTRGLGCRALRPGGCGQRLERHARAFRSRNFH